MYAQPGSNATISTTNKTDVTRRFMADLRNTYRTSMTQGQPLVVSTRLLTRPGRTPPMTAANFPRRVAVTLRNDLVCQALHLCRFVMKGSEQQQLSAGIHDL